MESAGLPDQPTAGRGREALRRLYTKHRSGVWILVALTIYCLMRLLPVHADLGGPGQVVLGVALAGMVLWISEAVPLGLTAVAVLALLGISPSMQPAAVFMGFASEVTFFLLGVVAIGAAVENSGLAERAARWLCRGAGRSPARLFSQMLASLPLLAFIIPSAITRNAILIPAYREALREMGVPQSGNAGRALMLALGVLNPLASSALLTGGITSITAATLIGGFSWFSWFAAMAVPYYLLILLGGGFLRLLAGRFETGGGPARPAAPAAPLTGAETWTVFVLLGTLVLWLTDSVHGLSPAIPALLGATLLLLPQSGVITWKSFEARLSWGLILTVGASLSLASAMTSTGAAGWLGAQFLAQVWGLADQPMLLVAALVVATATVHLGITNLAACIALLLPISATVAAAAGLNSVVCALIVTIVVDAVILYPVQTAANLLAYDSGYFDAADVRRMGVGMLGLTAVVVLLCLPYWELIGLPLNLPATAGR